MEQLVRQAHKLLLKNKFTLAVAESCTGGLLSKLLTDLPESSKYFILGVVSYSNQAKSIILKIPAGLLAQNGAVSRAVAQKMADSVKKLARSDFGIAITGIAGPSGGASKKPIGTVYIAISAQNKKICAKFNFTGNRSAIRKKSALKSLELLVNYAHLYRN